MPRVESSLWHEILTHVKQKHPEVCRNWFDTLLPVDLAGGVMRVKAENGIQENYLQSNCREYFTEAAMQATGQLVAVQFTKDPIKPKLEEPASSTGITLAVENNGEAAHSLKPPREMPANLSGRGMIEFDGDQMVLSPDYNFENFISGPNNQLAYAASIAVANQPGIAYNPLFIHGGVGLGKTHLLQAICQKMLEDRPETRILYVSCEAFMNQFLECVQSGQMNDFRYRYRHVDVLVIDDIHFLSQRDRTQEEFFHTFNELYQSNRQIVLSSDAAPAEIPHLEERLVSRFQWGLVANVSKPSFETRVAIVKAKVRLRGMEMASDVVEFIASKPDTNARELEGAITTIQAHAAFTQKPIDLSLAREALGEPAMEPRTNQVTLQNIIDAVTHFYNVKLLDLQSRRRHKSVTEPRQVCMWLARKRTRYSLEEIGGHFGGRDHTTVMHSIRAIEEKSTRDPQFARQVKQIEEQIQRTASQA